MTETVTISRQEYEALQARIEDLDDILAGYGATGATLPNAFAMRVLDGEHPVTVWREYKGLTMSALAKASGVSKGYLSEIEAGKKPGSVEAYKAVAAALDLPVDAVIP